MIVKKVIGTNGKVAYLLTPENEEDLQKIAHLEQAGKMTVHESFGDYFHTTEEQDDKTGMYKKGPKK